MRIFFIFLALLAIPLWSSAMPLPYAPAMGPGPVMPSNTGTQNASSLLQLITQQTQQALNIFKDVNSQKLSQEAAQQNFLNETGEIADDPRQPLFHFNLAEA